MKVDPMALAGIEAKVERTDHHLAVLNEEMAVWAGKQPQPWGLVPEVHDQGAKHFYRLGFRDPIPVMWSVVLGEILHDLRSALDQAVYWLTVDWQGHPLKGSAFPVNERKADFKRLTKKGAWTNDSGMHKVRGIGPGPLAFIEALQPYPQRRKRFYCRDLLTVHDLWNQDKHREVHVWGMRFREPERLEWRPYVTAATIDRRVLQDHAIVLRFFCSPPQPHVEMRGVIGADLTFDSGKRRRAGGANERLRNTVATIADIIRKLVNAVGQQERPISVDVWSAKPEP